MTQSEFAFYSVFFFIHLRLKFSSLGVKWMRDGGWNVSVPTVIDPICTRAINAPRRTAVFSCSTCGVLAETQHQLWNSRQNLGSHCN